MKRKLIETNEGMLALATEPVQLFPRMVAEWSTKTTYPELSALLVHVRALAMIHQTHHWQSKGDSFYGDHLLFERIYNATSGEIDSIAEKSIGLGTIANADLHLHTKQLNELISLSFPESRSIPQENELFGRSHRAEMSFLSSVAQAVDAMKAQGTLTRGLDNLLAGIEDTHEGHVYLLKQRLYGPMVA